MESMPQPEDNPPRDQDYAPVEQIRKFKEFFETTLYPQILENVRRGDFFLRVPFPELSRYDPDLANELLEKPEDLIKAAELAIHQFDLDYDTKHFRVRFKELPASQRVNIRDIRSSHLEKFTTIEGVVRQKSDVRPQVTAARFECPSCGNVINVLQLEGTFKEPTRCGCGRKGKFSMLSKELVDAQGIVVEESPENLEGGEQPKRINVFLKDDLVSPLSEKQTSPGTKIFLNGMVKEVPILNRAGAKSTRFDLIFEANYVEASQETFYEVKISEEDEQKIKEVAEDPQGHLKMVESLAPSIYGYDKVKESILMQMMGGVRKVRGDKVVSRGDMHILLVGDPGSGKSQLLKRASVIAPKARYVSGKGVSGAGLTASVVRDEFLKGWALEAGALVLASDGLCCLHPDSLVGCVDGLKKISSLFDKDSAERGMIGDDVVEVSPLATDINAYDEKNHAIGTMPATKVRAKRYNGSILHLKFASGLDIRVTPEHKLLDGETCGWKEAREFSVGESLIAPLKLHGGKERLLFSDLLGTDYCEDSRYARSSTSKMVRIDEVTPELAYLFGFIVGDGHISNTRRRSIISITQSAKKKAQLKKIRECWAAVCDEPLHENSTLRSVTIRGRKTDSSIVQLYTGNRLLADVFERVVGRRLEHAFSLPDEQLRAFLAGIMDSDGCLSTKTSTKDGTDYLVQHATFLISGEEAVNKNLVMLFRRLDLAVAIRDSGNRMVRAVRTCGREDVEQLIRTLSPYSIKMVHAEIKLKKRRITSASDYVPARPVAALLRPLLDLPKTPFLKRGVWSTLYRIVKNQQRPSRGQLRVLIEKLSDIMPKDIRVGLEKYIERDILMDEIVGIEEEHYEGPVYDLYVPGSHNFTANGVIVHNCMDEMDKMGEDDRAAMHEALEQQTVSVSKANIQATLVSRTTVLAAANPKFGRFDPFGIIGDQIDLPPTLINRFDLIFPIKDLPDDARDEKLATHILGLHQAPDSQKPPFDTDFLKKYIAYAKQYVHPRLSNEALEEVKAFYLKMRMSGSTDGGVKSVPISARQLEALVRMTEAAARIRLSDVAERRDARRAIDLLEYCLMQIGLDKETGKIDIDRIATGVGASQRNTIMMVKEVISDLENKIGKTIPMDDVVNEAKNRGLDNDKVEEAIEKLKRSGDIFEPRRGFITKL